MRDLARHQESKGFLEAGIIGDVDQPLVDDLGARLGGDVGPQIAGRVADGVDIGRGPGHAGGVGQGWRAAVEDRLSVAVAALVHLQVEFGLLHVALGELALDAAIQHGDYAADHLQVAELFRCNVVEHVLAAGIFLGQGLGEIAHRSGQLALGPAELLQHQAGESRVGLADADRVLQTFVVHEHSAASLGCSAATITNRSRRNRKAGNLFC